MNTELRKVVTKYGVTYEPENVFAGEENHPQCCFFELFPSSNDPYCDVYALMFCHMSNKDEPCKKCLGDYLKCPLAYGGRHA
jgi:hypothetical protein